MSTRDLLAAVVIVTVGLVLATVLNGGLFDLRPVGCPRLRDHDLLNVVDDASDAALAASYLTAHPEEARNYGIEMPEPFSVPPPAATPAKR